MNNENVQDKIIIDTMCLCCYPDLYDHDYKYTTQSVIYKTSVLSFFSISVHVYSGLVC